MYISEVDRHAALIFKLSSHHARLYIDDALGDRSLPTCTPLQAILSNTGEHGKDTLFAIIHMFMTSSRIVCGILNSQAQNTVNSAINFFSSHFHHTIDKKAGRYFIGYAITCDPTQQLRDNNEPGNSK